MGIFEHSPCPQIVPQACIAIFYYMHIHQTAHSCRMHLAPTYAQEFIFSQLKVRFLFVLCVLLCQLTTYGGKLKYAIYFEAREETGFTTYYPQVIIRGGPPTHTRIIVRHMAAPLIGQLTRHEIEMTEVTFPSAFFPRT